MTSKRTTLYISKGHSRMKGTTDLVINFLKDKKEKWEDIYSYTKIYFEDIHCDLSRKASQWLKFQDGSGELKLYEEDSSPYFEDLEIAETARDLALGGAALLIPIAGPWIAGGIIGLRGGQLMSTELSWRNTFIFLFPKSEDRCIFAMKFHYPKKRSVSRILEAIEEMIEEKESE